MSVALVAVAVAVAAVAATRAAEFADTSHLESHNNCSLDQVQRSNQFDVGVELSLKNKIKHKHVNGNILIHRHILN